MCLFNVYLLYTYPLCRPLSFGFNPMGIPNATPGRHLNNIEFFELLEIPYDDVTQHN